MKVFKRNQLVILVIALMLVTAGYLNYTSMYNNEAPVASSINLADTRRYINGGCNSSKQ